MYELKRLGGDRWELLIRLTALCFMFITLVGRETYGNESWNIDVPEGWKQETVDQLGTHVTLLTEPGDEDTASMFGHVVFEFPDALVDLKQITDGFLNSMNLDIRESLPVEQKPEIYRTSYLASEEGKESVYRLDAITFREAARQRMLLMAALPEKYEQLGGVDALLKTFGNGKSIDAITSAAVDRRTLLQETPDKHVWATSSSGLVLTHRDFKTVVEVIEFMAGRTMSGADIRWLLNVVDEEWERDPNLEVFDKMRDFLEQARHAHPAKRLESATALYSASLEQARETGESKQVMALVGRLNPVLAEKNGDILTERALEARLRSARTVIQLQGKSAQQIHDAIPRLRVDIVASFRQSPAPARKAMQAAESRWLRLLASMSSSTQSERLAKLINAEESAGSHASTLSLAHTLEEQAAQSSLQSELDRFTKSLESMAYWPYVLEGMRQR